MTQTSGIKGIVKLVTVWLLLCAPLTLMAAERDSIVVMLGDSITAWSRNKGGVRLTDYIESYLTETRHLQATVVNSGKGSDTAKGGYARLQKDVLAHDPDVVVIKFGLNDTGALTPEAFRQWMEKIIKEIQQKTQAKILLVTSTPFDNERHFWGNRYRARGGLDEYMDANICMQVRDLARQYDLPICDLHGYFRDKFKQDPELINTLILPDGVHLTDAGNRVAAEHLAPMIATLISASNGHGRVRPRK